MLLACSELDYALLGLLWLMRLFGGVGRDQILSQLIKACLAFDFTFVE